MPATLIKLLGNAEEVSEGRTVGESGRFQLLAFWCGIAAEIIILAKPLEVWAAISFGWTFIADPAVLFGVICGITSIVVAAPIIIAIAIQIILQAREWIGNSWTDVCNTDSVTERRVLGIVYIFCAVPVIIGIATEVLLVSAGIKIRDLFVYRVNAKICTEPLMKDGSLHFIFRLDSTSYRDRYVIWIKKYLQAGGWEFLKFELQGCMPPGSSVSSVMHPLCSQHEFFPQKDEERVYLRRVRETLDDGEDKLETLQQIRKKQKIILVEINKILQNKSGNKLIGILGDRALRLEKRLIDQLKGINLAEKNFQSERRDILEYVSVPLQLRRGGAGGLMDIDELNDTVDNYQMDQLIEESFLVEQAYEEIDRF